VDDADFHIDIRRDPPGGPALDAEVVRRAVRHTLHRHHRRQANVSIAVLDDRGIAELHQRFLGVPGPTDCLSFDLNDDPSAEGIDGEIVVSWETAQREAAARNHPPATELLLYVVHALLHLLGYDDHRPEDAARIHAEEDAILVELGLGAVYRSSPS
jgi:probable rRNA maturation factor